MLYTHRGQIKNALIGFSISNLAGSLREIPIPVKYRCKDPNLVI